MRSQDVLLHTATYLVADALATIIAALTDASGIPLNDMDGIASVLVAPVGQTITGGNLRFVFNGPVSLTLADNTLPTPGFRWMKFAGLDWTPATGQRDAASGDAVSFVRYGRGIWVPDAVTLSGGTTVDVLTYGRIRRYN